MYNLDVRTIKPTDRIGYPPATEIATLESKRRRNNVLIDLENKIEQFKRECKVEQEKENPNMKYIVARMRKINLMQATLESCR